MESTPFRFTYSAHQYRNNVQFFFSSFNDYIDQVEKLISDEIEKAVAKTEDLEHGIAANPEYADEFIEYHGELRQKQLLQNIYYDSMIISIYSFVEKQLMFVCTQLEKNTKLKVRDIDGNGITKYRTFLSKVIEIDFTPVQAAWSTLKQFAQLRNHLVHNGGFRLIDKSKEPLIQFLKQHSSIKLNDYDKQVGFHFLDNQILRDFCRIAREVVEYMYWLPGESTAEN